MAKITCLPDKKSLEVNKLDSILEILLANEIDVAHICGGNARCSTCRIMVLDGIENCSAPTSLERALIKKLDFPVHIRLACQTKVSGDVLIRRMVIDNEDINIVEGQLTDGAIANNQPLALLVATIRGSTNFDEVNFRYDMIHIMSRYFRFMQDIVGKYEGVISNFMGTKIVAVFGVDRPDLAAERATWAALDMLEAATILNDYLEQLSYNPLNLSIGIHYATTVMVPTSIKDANIFTPLGETLNLAGRAEAANQELGSELLVSEAVYEKIKDKATFNQIGNIALTNRLAVSKFKVYEITKMDGIPPIKVGKNQISGSGKNKLLAFFQKFS